MTMDLAALALHAPYTASNSVIIGDGKTRENAIFLKNGKTVICRCSTG